jgi:hypothetical protein
VSRRARCSANEPGQCSHQQPTHICNKAPEGHREGLHSAAGKQATRQLAVNYLHACACAHPVASPRSHRPLARGTRFALSGSLHWTPSEVCVDHVQRRGGSVTCSCVHCAVPIPSGGRPGGTGMPVFVRSACRRTYLLPRTLGDLCPCSAVPVVRIPSARVSRHDGPHSNSSVGDRQQRDRGQCPRGDALPDISHSLRCNPVALRQPGARARLPMDLRQVDFEGVLRSNFPPAVSHTPRRAPRSRHWHRRGVGDPQPHSSGTVVGSEFRARFVRFRRIPTVV